ncbi:ATP-binding protein, partial [Enterococcus hirae]
METVGEIMEKLIQKVLVQRGECPECGQSLYGWRTKNPDGSERCKPTCIQCGYKALRVQEDLQTERMYNESLKARAINFFKGGSVVPNQAL